MLCGKGQAFCLAFPHMFSMVGKQHSLAVWVSFKSSNDKSNAMLRAATRLSDLPCVPAVLMMAFNQHTVFVVEPDGLPEWDTVKRLLIVLKATLISRLEDSRLEGPFWKGVGMGR
jgi:hypothetical protein